MAGFPDARIEDDERPTDAADESTVCSVHVFALVKFANLKLPFVTSYEDIPGYPFDNITILGSSPTSAADESTTLVHASDL